MKTYKTYGACKHYTGSQPYPVHAGDAIKWASRADLNSMKPVSTRIRFACVLAGKASGEEFDRVFTVVSDGRYQGIYTRLSLGFRDNWPHIELFATELDAHEAMKRIIARYEQDPRWQRRS